MNKHSLTKHILWGLLSSLIIVVAFTILSSNVYAGINYDLTASVNMALLEGRPDNDMINDKDREVGYVELLEYQERLKTLYDLSPDSEQALLEIYMQANIYVANHAMTVSQFKTYIAGIESDMNTAISGATTSGTPSDFIFINNNSAVRSASYGQSTTVTVNLVNLGNVDLNDVIVTPVVSNKITEWPFSIQSSNDMRIISTLQAASTAEEIASRQQTLSWNYVVSKDALTGTYPIKLHVQYLRNGATEEKDLITYINITGAPGSGNLDGTSNDKADTSTPRIIVTGFSTDPETVYAGDTFKLKITVQNTSTTTAVSNIQFDLKAASEGDDSKNTYEAFLPTSGSSTIYVSKIEKGASYDLSIEMTSRGDLTQKPYVIDVNADYEDNNNKSYKATTSVSIPIKQEARVDTGDADIMPLSIAVGENSNVMFDIYNMGKTTLYNVQVSFVSSTLEGGNVFIGKLDPGATGSVDATVTGIAETTDDGTVTALISYEDESGNVSTLEKQINLFVYTSMDDGMMWDDSMVYDDTQVKKGMPWWGVLLIILVIIGAIVGIVIFTKKRKASKKKAKKKGKSKYTKYEDELNEEIYDYEESYETNTSTSTLDNTIENPVEYTTDTTTDNTNNGEY